MTIAVNPKTPYQQLLDAPPGVIAEVIDGELYMQAQPATPHQIASGRVLTFLEPPFSFGRGGPGGWWIVPEAQFSTSDPNWRTVVPDVAGWRIERAPVVPEGYFEIAPDWVCEVLSPSTRALDRGKKKDVYGEEGVKHLWLIDPYKRLFEAYETRNGAWVQILALDAAGTVSAPPFQEAPFELSDLWRGRPGVAG